MPAQILWHLVKTQLISSKQPMPAIRRLPLIKKFVTKYYVCLRFNNGSLISDPEPRAILMSLNGACVEAVYVAFYHGQFIVISTKFLEVNARYWTYIHVISSLSIKCSCLTITGQNSPMTDFAPHITREYWSIIYWQGRLLSHLISLFYSSI